MKKTKKKVRLEDYLYVDPMAVDAFNNALRNRSAYKKIHEASFDAGIDKGYALATDEFKPRFDKEFNKGLKTGFREGTKGFDKTIYDTKMYYYGQGLRRGHEEGWTNTGKFLVISRDNNPPSYSFDNYTKELKKTTNESPFTRMIDEDLAGPKYEGTRMDVLKREENKMWNSGHSFETKNYKVYNRERYDPEKGITSFKTNMIPDPKTTLKIKKPELPESLYHGNVQKRPNAKSIVKTIPRSPYKSPSHGKYYL